MAENEQTVELFCGPEKPFSSVASFLGYRTITFDPDPRSGADVIAAASEADPQQFPSAPLMVWMAPPSQGFIDKSGWDWSNYSPITSSATSAENTLRQCLNLAYQMKATWWFLEVPKSCLRKLPIMAGFNRGYPSRNRYTFKPKDFGGSGRQDIDVYTNAFWWVPLTQSNGEDSAAVATPSLDDSRAPPFVYLDMLNQFDAYSRSKGVR